MIKCASIGLPIYYRIFTDDATAGDSLKCNTEKDKNVRMNHRTAGMPCVL